MLRNSDRENASSYNAGLPLGLQTKLVLALIISSFTLYLGKFLHIALPFWMFLDKPTLMLALHIAPTKLPALWLAFLEEALPEGSSWGCCFCISPILDSTVHHIYMVFTSMNPSLSLKMKNRTQAQNGGILWKRGLYHIATRRVIQQPGPAKIC